MIKDSVRQIVNLVSTIVPIVVGGLVGSGVADASNRNPVLITPAGYTFSIWGLIFIATLAFAVYQALPAQRENPRLRRIGYWYAVGNLLCAAWDLIFPRQLIALSELVIVVTLLTLLIAYSRAGVPLVAASRLERWLLDVPLAIYTAWLTFATVVNTAVFLKSLGWNGSGAPALWAIIILVVAALIVSIVGFIRRDVAYAAVGTWALVGVVIANLHNGEASIAITAAILAVLTFVIALYALIRRTPPSLRGGLQGSLKYTSSGN